MSGDIIVRPFRPDTSDDAGAKALEARASQHANNVILSTVVKVHLAHTVTFDAKARLYDDHVVLLAVDPGELARRQGAGDDGFVCGCICLGIKDAWLQGKKRRLGYLFDLRVHEDYQRRKIGSQLNTAIEQTAKERGVELIYLTVNLSNDRARKFYAKYGYCVASMRSLLFTPLLLVPASRSDGDPSWIAGRVRGAVVRSVGLHEAVAVAEKAYGGPTSPHPGRDLTPVGGLGALVQACPGRLIASWVAELGGGAENGGSEAAITLWDGDGLSAIAVERIFLTPATWRHPWTQGGLLLGGLAFLTYWGHTVWSSPLSILNFLSGVLLVAVSTGTALFGALFRFAITRQRMRARLIAPSAQGPKGLELLRFLAQHARSEAKRLGFAVVVVNANNLDPKLQSLLGPMESTKPRTVFLQKWISADAPTFPDNAPEFSPDCFFDPRDLS